jgi:hypothetical protein
VTRFRHNCDEGANCWLHRRWDSDHLGRAAEAEDGTWPFPRKISPSDIDGFLECNGEVLFIETKELGAPIPVGQGRALTSLSLKGTTVLLQECDPPCRDVVVSVRLCVDGKWRPAQNMNRLQRDRLVQRWFHWAETGRKAA